MNMAEDTELKINIGSRGGRLILEFERPIVELESKIRELDSAIYYESHGEWGRPVYEID